MYSLYSVNIFRKNKFTELFKLKAFVNDIFTELKSCNLSFISYQNIVGKAENASQQYFLLFQQFSFKKLQELLKARINW